MQVPNKQKNQTSEEKKYRSKLKNYFGYVLPIYPVTIAITSVFAALICIVTMLIAIPVPATQGFINIGDALVMVTALLFGPFIGALAGGIGSMFADLFLGYTLYAPATLLIKGLEGLLVGFIANPKQKQKRVDVRDILGVIIGGLIMVAGYFLYEGMLFGLNVALIEVFLNGLIQFGVGALIALIFILTARENILESIPGVFEKVFSKE
ncbi:MAG: ECF transporter S component [Promethearchaeia archaeon]